MLKLETLKKEYIDPILESSGLPFKVYLDTGDFHKAIRNGNTVTEFINGIMAVSGSSVEYAGEQEIVGISTELKFLVRVDDDMQADGSFDSIEKFRDLLSQAFSSVKPKFNVTEDGKTYTVVVAYTLPDTGERAQRSGIGDSLSYSCSVYFAYLANSINATDVKITIDGEEINFLAVGITRRPSIIANLYTDNVNGESATYSESAAFAVDLTMPAFISSLGGILSDYILGISDSNEPHTVVITYGNGTTITKQMIFGESKGDGQGIENVRYTVSLIPYAGEAVTGG
ncbi:MAG: hypothetical protein K2N22_04405 [Clostridia bacterium]|nr:hypothetical protein [Clostridia bacterium]